MQYIRVLCILLNSECGVHYADSGHAGGVRVRYALPDEKGGPGEVPVRRTEDHHLPACTLLEYG